MSDGGLAGVQAPFLGPAVFSLVCVHPPAGSGFRKANLPDLSISEGLWPGTGQDPVTDMGSEMAPKTQGKFSRSLKGSVVLSHRKGAHAPWGPGPGAESSIAQRTGACEAAQEGMSPN